MFLPIVLFAAAALAQAADAPTSRTEMLGINVPDEFEMGHQARNDTLQIMELVEPPETVETWSKLITSMMFFNAAHQGMDAFYGQWRDGLRAACEGITDTVVKGTVDGMPALRATLACPKNAKTGKPENLEAIVVQGRANMMIVQVAFRRPITPDDAALIERVAGSMKVCDQRTLPLCSARKAIGFLPEDGQSHDPSAKPSATGR
ncbi:hypothetical protein [Sphingomonas sp.]|uniref:hypothetical protein n=1 Tax=Sphingomonas sp. TaxID=28214 RepID=UPI002FC79594